jgi:hypothetical protein
MPAFLPTSIRFPRGVGNTSGPPRDHQRLDVAT